MGITESTRRLALALFCILHFSLLIFHCRPFPLQEHPPPRHPDPRRVSIPQQPPETSRGTQNEIPTRNPIRRHLLSWRNDDRQRSHARQGSLLAPSPSLAPLASSPPSSLVGGDQAPGAAATVGGGAGIPQSEDGELGVLPIRSIKMSKNQRGNRGGKTRQFSGSQ